MRIQGRVQLPRFLWSGLSTRASTPLETVHKERQAWQAPASCLITEHAPDWANGIQGQLHTWLNDFLNSPSHCVALNFILSSPLPVKAGVPQGSDLSQILFPILINELSDS